MPAHNEEAFLATAVRDVAAALRARGGPFELVVVENGSADATVAVAEGLAAEVPELRLLRLPAADYGGALRTGFLAARGDVVVNFDVDYYDVGFLEGAVAVLGGAGGAGLAPVIVVATKRAAGAHDARPWPRRLVTGVFSAILRVGFGLQASDTHGMKALLRAPLVPLVEASRLGRDLFDTELVLRAERAGLGVAELPVAVEERRPSRTPIARRAAGTVVNLGRLWLVLRRERRCARPWGEGPAT